MFGVNMASLRDKHKVKGCSARACPPSESLAAAVAASQTQFLEGQEGLWSSCGKPLFVTSSSHSGEAASAEQNATCLSQRVH